MAWLVRALLKTYKRRFGEPPPVTNRTRFEIPHVRFNAIFFGDKEIWRQWASSFGLELAPVIRAIVGLYIRGDFEVSREELEDLESVKKEKFSEDREQTKEYQFIRYASAYRIKGETFQPGEYWPVNQENNVENMLRGLKRKKKSYVKEAILWYKKRYPRLNHDIAM